MGSRLKVAASLGLVAVLTLFSAPVSLGQESRRTANNGNAILEGVPDVPEEVVDALNRFQNVRGAEFQGWAVDGQSLYVTTRFGDVNQLHRVDFPGGARHQLTFLDEPVRGIVDRPEHAELVFSMDEGGSEFFQLFLYDPRTGEHHLLTDGRSRNGSPVWNRDGNRMAFTSTRRNGRSNDVWLIEGADPRAARMLLEAPDGSTWLPSDWSPDGRSLLVRNYHSVSDSRIYLVDVETGHRRLVAGGELEVGNYSAIRPRFRPDGDGFFLATDVGGEFAHLAYQDLVSRQRRTITADVPWNLEAFAISDDGQRAAFVVNEDAVSRLYLMDPETFQYRPVEDLPTGLIRDIDFNPDGMRLGMTLNTPRTPSDVFTLDVSDGQTELSRWTHSEIGGLNPEMFVEPELVHYPTFDEVDGKGRMIPAFVYRPAGAGPHPVIVSIHGGPEGQYRPAFSSTFQLWLHQLNAAVIAPNVRGSSGYGRTYVQLDNGRLREDSVKDIGALLDWIATQPDLDESRVAVIGGSYGGYMVLASAVHFSDRLAAAVEIVGISNFVTFLENTQAYRRDLRRLEYGDERDPEMRRFLDSISPTKSVHRIQVPLFVAQGQNDPRVPVTESEQIVEAVRSSGRDIWYMQAQNEGHGFRKKENRDLFEQIVVMFLSRYLTPGN